MPRKSTPQTPSAKVEAALIKLQGQEIVDGILNSSVDDLKAKLVKLAAYENETETAQKDDVDLADLKEQVKLAEAPYKETMKGISLQRKFISFQLESKGKA